ncbi:enoyl-CoA hydratase [Mangrovicella endophytica]|uniref:enoyl-CoA hydratase n=1 Tax=Mangrovicella endophytica TaxID=2066697 RepID=UPI000C9E455B|nr:enoyl-CoA hydratase [Mangrovicella endophytica]
MADILEMGITARHPVDIQRADGIIRIVLSSPPSNALSVAMLDALIVALDEASAAPSCRVVIIAAVGPVFSAGHDLKELTAHRSDDDAGRAFFTATMARSAELMQAISRHRCPVIAEVNGLATAAGCQLVASCDLAIASEEATFCTPGVNIGLFCSAPAVALSRNLSRKHAMEMLLTGETIDARSARDFGLVNRVVPPEYLGTVVGKYATMIASKSAAAIQSGKAAFHRQADMDLGDAYADASAAMVDGLLTPDAEEGIAAFVEKRQPVWPHD